MLDRCAAETGGQASRIFSRGKSGDSIHKKPGRGSPFGPSSFAGVRAELCSALHNAYSCVSALDALGMAMSQGKAAWLNSNRVHSRSARSRGTVFIRG